MKEPTAPLRLEYIPLINKTTWVLGKVRGKKVLHAGPTDYPLTESKASRGELLHLQLQPVCAELIGVDLSKSAIELLRANYQVDNIIHGNIEEVDRLFSDRKFDIVLAGDVIEHINNVGLFFQAARKVLAPGGTLLITVPNAFSLKKILGVILFWQERNHPDHLYYFTPLSLQQAAYRFGYDIIEMASFMGESPGRKENWIANVVIKTIMFLTRNNMVADELAVVMRPTPTP